MYIRNYKGDLVKIDLSKINNENQLVLNIDKTCQSSKNREEIY